MANGAGTKVAQNFSNSPSGGAVSQCCKNVKGEWKEIPKAYPNGAPDILGSPQAKGTYYFDTIPKGLSYSLKMRHKFKIKGKLVCKCMDDGRILSESAVDKDVTFEAQTPVYSQNITKKLVGGWLGWASLAYDVYKAGKIAYDIYKQNPEMIKELAKAAGPAADKAVEEIKNSADSLCKAKHKPCNDPEPAKPEPAKPGQGQGDGPLIS
ncbi:MAG: hypothetical protein IPK82_31725 [Polyangiaceae bacterium]|nr:hypothetical protein [Polyangiaceae bacterium]